MEKLSDLPNIGKVLEEKLNNAGVQNVEDLRRLGTESVFTKIKIDENPEACINMLYAIEGAVQGIRWHGLSKSRKEELKEFLRSLNI